MGAANVTIDHEKVREWVEARGARPACVKGTGDKGDTGLLRIDFPDGEEAKLAPISWDEFFDKFEEKELAFLYQDETVGGKESRFVKLVSRHSVALPAEEFETSEQPTKESKSMPENMSEQKPDQIIEKLRMTFIHGLSDALDAEVQVSAALPGLDALIQDKNIIQIFKQHAKQTEQQVKRLEQIFQELNAPPEKKTCKGMLSILQEFDDGFKELKPEGLLAELAVLDGNAKIEHYEIATYESLCELADHLGLKKASESLKESLREEQEMLSGIQEISHELMSKLPKEQAVGAE